MYYLPYILNAPILKVYIFKIVISPSWNYPLFIMQCLSLYSIKVFNLKSILSDMRTTTSAFFCFAFAQNIFFHPLTYSLYVSLSLRQISCRKHIYQSYFCIPPASLFLLVCTFNLFTFNYLYLYSYCYCFGLPSVVLGQVLYVFLHPLLFHSLLSWFDDNLQYCVVCFFICVCVSIVSFFVCVYLLQFWGLLLA